MKILDDNARYKLLKLLEKDPNLSQRELAKELGISLGKVNYCLKALIEKGWVKAGNFQKNENKKAYAYMLTPKGLREKAQVTLRFLKRKQQDYDELLDEISRLKQEVSEMAVAEEIE